MAGNEVYLVARDHPGHPDMLVCEDLLQLVIKGKQKQILEYDFTEEQQQITEELKRRDREISRIMEFKQMPHVDEEK